MKFQKLKIFNFRSIGQEGVTIDFDAEKNFYSFIGSNNAGKSNILDALLIVLGHWKFKKYQWSEKDFHNCQTHYSDGKPVKLRIELWLHESSRFFLENVFGQSDKQCVAGFSFELKAYEKEGENYFVGQLKSPDHFAFGLNGETLIVMEAMRKKGSGTESDENVIKRNPHPAYAKDYLYRLGNLYYLDIQDLHKFFSPKGYSPFADILRNYKEDFPNPTNTITLPVSTGDEVQTKEISHLKAFEMWSEKIKSILKTKQLNEIEKRLGENVAKYLGIPTKDFSIGFSILDFEELFDELMLLNTKENNCTELPITKNGAGYLSVLRLAVIETLLSMKEFPNSIFLIEEPEIYLHPHLERFFYEAIKNLASAGHQFFFSTHSINFLSFEDYQHIIRICKTEGVTQKHQSTEEYSLKEISKLENKFLEKGTKEFLFAKKVILTEGKGDRIIISYLVSDLLKIDTNLNSVSIVDCGGLGNMSDYKKVCRSLNIQFFPVIDADKESKEAATTRSEILIGLTDTEYYQHPDRLEVSLGLEKGDKEPSRLLELVKEKKMEEIQTTYPNIHSMIEKIEHFLKA